MFVAHNSLMQYPHLRYIHLLHITGIAEYYVFNLPKCVNIITVVAVYRFCTLWTNQHKLNISYTYIGVLQMMRYLYMPGQSSQVFSFPKQHHIYT